jgi:hypothetical protein
VGSVFIQADMPVTLRAAASDGDGIAKVRFYDGSTLVGEDSSVPYETDWVASSTGTHTLTAVATDNVGSQSTSASVTVTVQGAQLPGPISQSDIGNVGFAGNGTYDNGTFTLVGSGADIWGKADAFHFLYRPLTGDGEVIVRIASLQNTNGWAKGGAMMRETLAAGSSYAFSLVSAASGAAFQYRATTNTAAAESANVTGPVAPYWLRMVRNGNSFTAYRSTDGTAWTQTGTAQTITMASTIYAGVAVTAHNNAAAAQAVADNLTFINTDTQTYSVKVNFQPASSAVPTGYLADKGAVFGVQPGGLTYGWNADKSASALARTNGTDTLHNTLIPMGTSGSGSIWELALPNARYNVRIVAGDPTSPNGTQHVTVEGASFLNAATNSGTPFADVTSVVNVTDGRLTVALGASALNTKICFIEVSSYAVAANIAPYVVLTSPFDGATFGTPPSLSLTAKAIDTDSPIARVEFLLDGGKVGEDANPPYSFDWTLPPVGVHTLVARAIDAAGSSSTSAAVAVTIKAQNDPPVVTLTSPSSGLATLPNDSIFLSAEAADADGSVAKVEFWSDNVKLGETASLPYSWNLTGPLTVGNHLLKAVAVDNAGASATSPVIAVNTLPLNLKMETTSPDPNSQALTFTAHATLPAGRSYVIEWTSDLVNWLPLQTGTSNGQLLEVTDTATNVKTRFYRIRITN